MSGEIVCPFCQARRRLVGDGRSDIVWQECYEEGEEGEEGDWTFTGQRLFHVYKCPCGAVASPSICDALGAKWRLDDLEQALCSGSLDAEREECHLDLNYVSQTDPPLLLLWAKRR